MTRHDIPHYCRLTSTLKMIFLKTLREETWKEVFVAAGGFYKLQRNPTITEEFQLLKNFFQVRRGVGGGSFCPTRKTNSTHLNSEFFDTNSSSLGLSCVDRANLLKQKITKSRSKLRQGLSFLLVITLGQAERHCTHVHIVRRTDRQTERQTDGQTHRPRYISS